MNSFERYEAVLRGEKPDKLPLYVMTVDSAVASQMLGRPADTGGNILHFAEEASWLDGEAAHDEFADKHFEDTLAIQRLIGADIIRETWRSNNLRPTRRIDDYTLEFESPGRRFIKRYSPQHATYGIVYDTQSADESALDSLLASMQKALDNPAPLPTEDQMLASYADILRLKRMAKPYFPVIAGGSVGIASASPPWLMAAALEPELMREYYAAKAQRDAHTIAFLGRQGFRTLNAGADIASDAGTIISPESFHEIFLPYLQTVSKACAQSNMHYCYRTDGNTRGIWKTLFEDGGVQAYGEVDRGAGMTVQVMREAYPDLIIWGNVRSSTLHHGDVQTVREETRATLRESGGSHHVPGPSNAILAGTPVENVWAMVEEIHAGMPA